MTSLRSRAGTYIGRPLSNAQELTYQLSTGISLITLGTAVKKVPFGRKFVRA